MAQKGQDKVASAIRRVKKYIQSIHTVPEHDISDQRPIKRQRTNWRFKALSKDSGSKDEIDYKPSTSNIHKLEAVAECIYCNARRFQSEPPNFCCGSGSIILADTEVPDQLYDLFVSDSEEAKEFRKNFRAYNSIFAFTSFGVKFDKELASSRQGIYTFRAQGQVYHDLPSLLPNSDKPCYFQLYFFDKDNELSNRISILQEANLSEEGHLPS